MAIILKRSVKISLYAIFTIAFMFILPVSFQKLNNSDQMNNIFQSESTDERIITKIFTTVTAGRNTAPSNNDFTIETVTPSTILRGNFFTVSGRLVDLGSGLGIANQPIHIYWERFSWAEYDADPENFEDTYQIGEGNTDSEGYFSISCRDSDYSRKIGSVEVFSVFYGDPLLGPPIQNRQFSSDFVECYGRINLYMELNQTSLRENETFWAASGLLFDNGSLIDESNGEDITYDWLGTQYTDTIVGYISNQTFSVDAGTTVGQYPFVASINVSIFNFPYIVGSITSESQIGTSAADWANRTRNVSVFSGAGINFNILEPTPPGPGENPEIVRGITSLNLTGTITDASDDPFGFEVDLNVYVYVTNTTSSNYLRTSTVANPDGDFSVSFTLTGGFLSAGVNVVWLDSPTGGINAVSEIREITIVGNSTLGTTTANQTNINTIDYMVMPGEVLDISGTIIDSYNSEPVVDMIITAQWEDFGVLYNTNTSASGDFSFNFTIPSSIDSSVNNGSIYLLSSPTDLFTGFDYNFTIDVFTDVSFGLTLNSTVITEGTIVSRLNGSPLYNNRTFTMRCNFSDQFDRPIVRPSNNNQANITIQYVGDISRALIDGSIFYTYDGSAAVPAGVPFSITITFIEGVDFSFQIQFEAYPTPSTPPTSGTTTPPGGNYMGYILIGILVALTAGIVIISIVYAFGRFRRTKKRSEMGFDTGLPDLDTILKRIDEAEKAKDYRRASILCYRAFEAICSLEFGITDTTQQSPRELARIVAQTNRVPIRDVTMLVMRYEEARYSDHKIVKESFTQARQALHNIQLALENKS